MTNLRQVGNHVYGKKRPSTPGTYQLSVEPARDTYFRDLPPPTGAAPFRLELEALLPGDQLAKIALEKKLTFHVNGDMGGIKYGVPQELVAKGMEADFDESRDVTENPAFLYVLGDCVYFNGEISEYYSQFYQPYEFYPGPILAVPGNHDGENLPDGNTLDGFVRNFCAKEPGIRMPESGDSHRTAMIQPNVYWTLATPLLNVVGLYSNVPEGGDIRSPQTEWLVEELSTLPNDVPLLVALHHPIYSADDHHSGSVYMKRVLEDAASKSGRHPEMVLAGHVHNYQRLTKTLSDDLSSQVPFIVAGAGGYHNLHDIAKVNGEPMIPPVVFTDEENDSVQLESYSADHHGFLRLSVTDQSIVGHYYIVPRPQDSWSKGNRLVDRFELDWRKRRYVPNTLSAISD